MTNPNNIVRVRARNGGRASVYEANGWCQSYTTGLLEGNGVLQNTSADMNVLVGGSATKPDVVVASNPAGYKIALDLVGQQAIGITNPATNSRISAIVAYTDDLSLATTEDTVTGAPASCGLIVVNGTAASSPTEPTDTQIRNAITADGATGSQACYCVIATVLVASNTSVIDNSLITNRSAGIGSKNIDYATTTAYSSSNTSQSVTQTFADCLSVDVSNIPDGATFVATFVGSFSGTETLTGALLRTYYNSTAGGEFRQTTTYGKSVCAQELLTKVNGVDELKIQCRKDNSSSVSITNRSCVCVVVG